jgi:chromosomal replication initiator protein
MQAWEHFLALQEAELGKDTVLKWLRPLKILRFDACNLYLEAKDSFQALWFEEHIRKKILQKFVNNNNKKIRVHLAIANAPQKPKVKTKTVAQTQAAPAKFQLTFDELDPNCTFEQFVQTEPNQLPYRLLSEIELGVFNPIYIHGRGGSGKTHLLMATVHALRQKGLNVIYCRAETFTEHVVTAIRAGEMNVFREAYRKIDVLCIDDVQVFSRKGATQEELFHTFNTLHLAGKQIILSANCAPGELQYIEPRLISRFEWGIVLPVEVVDQENIATILQKKAEAFRFPLHPKVANFLLETFTSSTKSLMRALEALILRTHLQESSTRSIVGVTVQSARHQLEDLIHEEERTALTPSKVVKAVAEQFGIKPEDILSKAQSRDCVVPRQVAMYLMRMELKLPYMRIGEIFGKDHSTVMSSVRVIQKGMDAEDREIADAVHAIIKNLK